MEAGSRAQIAITAGRIRGGRHIEVAKGTPLTNLHLTLLDRLGVPVDTLGDSTGRLEI